jgi:hypothetical protein
MFLCRRSNLTSPYSILQENGHCNDSSQRIVCQQGPAVSISVAESGVRDKEQNLPPGDHFFDLLIEEKIPKDSSLCPFPSFNCVPRRIQIGFLETLETCRTILNNA